MHRAIGAGGRRPAASARSLAEPLAWTLGAGCGPIAVPLPQIALAATYGRAPLSWRDAGLFLLFLSVLPAALVLVARHFGYVRDLDVTDRAERAPIVAAAAVLAAIGAVALTVVGAQPTLTALAGAAAAQGTLLALLTLGEKVSYHAAGTGALAVAGFVLGGPTIGLPLGLLALATGWSRCHLGRHTPRQVALGLLSSLTLLLWLPA